MQGALHEQRISAATRKANGVYYTPVALIDHVVRHALDPLPSSSPIHLLDPACGIGAFLAGCNRPHCKLHGVEIDAKAVRITRQVLGNALIHHGNALLDFDWDRAFPDVMQAGGFDMVIGNPPWGQKAIQVSEAVKRRIWRQYPSSAGIFDWFRPFVELSIRLLKPGGRFGMVLPDTILLKDYPQTRQFLLDQLEIERIEWWGKAFTDATIDVATIIGTKKAAAAGHRVFVAIHDPHRPLEHMIPQADFRSNPRKVFNLHLTAERRAMLERLADCPRLGDWFEIHEGVHSGNLREELFVEKKRDATCRPLWFGRDEIRPYRLEWAGQHIRLGAVPAQRTKERYANLGRPEWHERQKVLVRRTGDRVLAAVDEEGHYASNNFFLVFPRREGGLNLHGLCALLNSRIMTWYFRAIEPRQGRAFAELKIKHLRTFPLPRSGWEELNRLGKQCARESDPLHLQDAVDALVLKQFGLKSSEIGEPGGVSPRREQTCEPFSSGG